MNVVCPYCRIEGSIDDKFSGREIRCPKCQQIFVAGQDVPPAVEAFQAAEESPAQEEAPRHLQWYYARDNKPAGPLADNEFHHLAAEGVITDDTLVWNQTLPGWQPYGSLAAGAEAHATHPAEKAHVPSGENEPDEAGADAGGTPLGGASQAECSQCHGTFAADEVLRIGSVTLCATCKPVYYQKIRQEVALPPRLQYAGFWVRFVAKLIDSMIVVVAGGIISYVFGLIFPNLPEQIFSPLASLKGGHSLIELLVGVGYSTFFVGRFAATPGKMALGLKIITPTGGKITYQRAFARYWGEMVSALILGVGYLLVIWDEEKRALHDRICGTRVVKERD